MTRKIYVIVFLIGITAFITPIVYVFSLLWNFALSISEWIGIITASIFAETIWVSVLLNLNRQRNEERRVHSNIIRKALEEWIKKADYGFIKIVPSGFCTYRLKKPKIKFYFEAKEHLKSGYNKEPYPAWNLWKEIINKWVEEKKRVKTLWCEFERIVTTEINSLNLTLANWDRSGYAPISWYDLSKILYYLYKEIKEFVEKQRYIKSPEIDRQNEYLNLHGEPSAKGSLQELRILKKTIVILRNNQELIKLVEFMKPIAYIKATEKFEECINKIITELELGKPLLGKCSTLGY